MYTLSPVEGDTISSFFLHDPKLALLALPDEDLHTLKVDGKFYLDLNVQAEGVYEDGEMVGILMWNMFTDMVINMHLYLNSKHHGTGKFKDVHVSILDWAKESGRVRRIVVFSPASCVHIHHAMLGVGFEQEGRIKEAMEWRQQVVDILIYGRNL